MPQWNDLPQELLDMVVYQARTPTNATSAYHSLRQLALVCRRLRHTAQEALHKHIVIEISDYEPFFDDEEGGGGKSRLGSLVRTLIQRPDLASAVMNLKVAITPWHIGHFGRCNIYKECGKDYCKCDWDDTVELCQNFLLMTNFWGGPTLYDDQWMQNIEDGSQLAVLGVILVCTHGLQKLAINRYSGFYLTDDSELVKPHYFTLSGIFGSLLHSSAVTTSHIPGLADLRSLSCSGLVPCDLIRLPHLRALQFGLQNRQWSDAPQAIRLPSLAMADKLSTSVTHLKVTLDVGCLVAGSDGIFKHLKELIGRFDGLRHLIFDVQALLRCQYEWPYDILFGDFQALATKIPTSEIETLVIDTQDLRDAEVGFYEYDLDSRKPQRWVESLRPARSLDHLASLRKIVASQELFFSVDEHFLVCDLPYSLEEISIIDTTFALHRWAQRILDTRSALPNLRLITIWNRYEWNDALKDDVRLGNEGEETDEEDWSEDEGEDDNDGVEDGDANHDFDMDGDLHTANHAEKARLRTWQDDFLEADTEVWEHLKGVGVHIEFKHYRGRPWCEL